MTPDKNNSFHDYICVLTFSCFTLKKKHSLQAVYVNHVEYQTGLYATKSGHPR